MKPILVYDYSKQLDAESFLARLDPAAAAEPVNPTHKQVYGFFIDYVRARNSQGKGSLRIHAIRVM